jgi:hypothetical protein
MEVVTLQPSPFIYIFEVVSYHSVLFGALQHNTSFSATGFHSA